MFDFDKIFSDCGFKHCYEILSNNDFHVCATDNNLNENWLLYDENIEYRLGASKICIPMDNYVLKKSLSGRILYYDGLNDNEEYHIEEYEDDTKIEYEVYKKSCELGVQNFFAEMVYIGQQVYIQEKIKPVDIIEQLYGYEEEMGEDYNIEWDEKLCENMKEKYSYIGLDDLFDKFEQDLVAYMFYKCYTNEELNALQKFLNQYDINDLHGRNVGMIKINGDWKPIIFDYCGYGSLTKTLI